MIGWALGLRKERRKQRKFGPALCERDPWENPGGERDWTTP